jgi:hypothetical protein
MCSSGWPAVRELPASAAEWACAWACAWACPAVCVLMGWPAAARSARTACTFTTPATPAALRAASAAAASSSGTASTSTSVPPPAALPSAMSPDLAARPARASARAALMPPAPQPTSRTVGCGAGSDSIRRSATARWAGPLASSARRRSASRSTQSIPSWVCADIPARYPRAGSRSTYVGVLRNCVPCLPDDTVRASGSPPRHGGTPNGRAGSSAGRR